MKPHTVSDVVSSVYCERKCIFDRLHGDHRPLSVRAQAHAGTVKHKLFELESRALQAPSSRCFVASAVYGFDAPETEFLRGWRDRVLIPSIFGRIFVRVYYAISPAFAALLCRSHTLTRATRVVLGVLLRLLKMPS